MEGIRADGLEMSEEALFMLLMNQMAELQGAELLRECERLNRDPAAAVPAELDAKCLETIKMHFKVNN